MTEQVDGPHGRSNVYYYNVACQILSYVLVGTCMLARIYTKIFIKPRIGLEDCTLSKALFGLKDKIDLSLQIPAF